MNLKPFDLQRALAGDPVVTRAGSIVKELHYFEKLDGQKLYCVVHTLLGYSDSGTFWSDGREDAHDLFMMPIKKTYWINIYKSDIEKERMTVRNLYESLDDAILACDDENLLKTISFEVEV